ncbi:MULTISPECIES: hypothetical protein [Cetobacterium]|uniref:Replication initiator protein A n=1 Tax=Candidatus Cetobacterium colombiensis TaxID=3073100 RepID=A0ABU4WCL7_9FUSO|nr:hypothetical protein [Candidatus Cetobacterium colombiensis]MDX8337262.1 hypothetical protein [Candidatus Cetobacterium colombiensis]
MSKKINDLIQIDGTDFIETIDTGPTYYLEEDISIDEKYIKNKALVRMDMNIVQFPIFSKNTKRKKNEITTYFFNKNRDTYITVKPSSGELIPGEGEERVFIALMKLMKEKGMTQEFIVTAKEIKDAVKTHSNNYISEIKRALLRLSETSYNFKNTMYSNEMNTILKEEISTPILTFKAKKLDLSGNESIKSTIKDGRIREVYVIKISDHFYKNIVKRGYLVYDSDILLDINSSVSRTLYMLIEKIRFEELYVRESVFALIKKIPLKYEKKTLSTTIKTLEKAFNELKQKHLIKDFKFIKTSTWLESDVEIYFDEGHNILKQERFEEDNKELKNMYNNLAISFTEKNIEEVKPLVIVTNEMIAEVLDKMPSKAKVLKSMPKLVKETIENYGYEKVKATALYMATQKKVTSPRAYFLKALENNWADEILIRINLEQNSSSINERQEGIKDEKPFKIDENIVKFFNNLPDNVKKDIEEKTYQEYIKECGQETKIQKIAFNAAKNTLIYKYLYKNNLHKNEIIQPVEEIKIQHDNNLVLELDLFNDIINKAIDMYRMILDLTSEKIIEVKRETLKELGTKFILKKLTIDEINQTIAEKLK